MNALYDTSVIESYRTENVHLGPALFGKAVTLESIGEAYLMTMHSQYFEDSGESALAEELETERAVLPRRVIVHFGREEEGVYKVNYDDVAGRISVSLGASRKTSQCIQTIVITSM